VTPEALRDLIIEALEDRKGQRILALDVRRLTSITDIMVIVSGTSNRHVKALVDSVAEAATAAGARPLGVEGLETCEWVLVDLGDVLVHVMQNEARNFYDLERLWTEVPVATGNTAGAEAGV
jgi:ribosome-associated protein